MVAAIRNPKSLLSLAVLTIAVLAFPASSHADDGALVNCSESRFQSGTSAYTLMGWSRNEYRKAKERFDAGKPPLERVCTKLIDMRGDAHCQELGNADYRKALEEAQVVCTPPASPAKPSSTAAAGDDANTAVGETPAEVDCSDKRFQSQSSVRALMSWSSRNYEDAQKTRGSGIYPDHACEQLITRRGSAHCKEPKNAEILAALNEGLALCHSLANPAPATKKMLVDCAETRFQKNAPVPDMIKWSQLELKNLSEWSDVQARAKCEQAYNHAGSAHCRLPADESGRQAVLAVIKACAADEGLREQAKKVAVEAEAKRIADAKAARTIVTMPKVRFKGSQAGLAKQMLGALVAGGVAKKAGDVTKVSPMGSWKTGRFVDTKLPYRKASALVLWKDDDGDGVCRFVGYNFIQTKQGKSWSPLAFQSFCNGCQEGWTKCKKSKTGR